MPILQIDDFILNYQIDGPDNGPVLILSNSLGTEMDLWSPQIAAFSAHFRVLRYDTRGHGETDVTPGPYNIAQLGEDVIALMDHLDIKKAHFCGLSMGGMTGIWLASHHPQRIDRLVLSNTGALIGTPSLWNTRMEIVNSAGLKSIVPNVLERWFTDGFRAAHPDEVEKVAHMLVRTVSTGYTASCGALRDADLRDKLGDIKAPTLVITGTHDTATPPEDGKFLAAGIAGAKYLELDAAHISNWEQPAQYTAAVLEFLG